MMHQPRLCPVFARLASLVLAALAAIGAARAATLEIGMPTGLPPYYIERDESGMEFEIVREALRRAGYEIVPVFAPMARLGGLLQAGAVDCVSPINEQSGVEAFYSDVVMTYQNFAITLAERHPRLQSFADLRDKSVSAFKGAMEYLGPEYATAVRDNPRYREMLKQSVQPILLYEKGYDVIIADRRIFDYFALKLHEQRKFEALLPARYHPIFPETHYKLACRDAAVRDAFDAELRTLTASGEYARIIGKYVPAE